MIAIDFYRLTTPGNNAHNRCGGFGIFLLATFQPINFNKCDDDNDKDIESNDENKAEDDYVVMVTNLD